MSEGQAKAFPVSWDQFHRDARALAWRLSGAGPFTALVCVTRGGLVPAAIVARELGIRLIETVCVASYHDYDEQGKTAQVLRDMLPRAHFATIYAKPLGRPVIDTFVTEVSQDTWIYFPWDMGLSFQPPIAKATQG